MRFLLTLILVPLTACSFLFIEGPPSPREPATFPICTTTKGWVGVDALFALANLGAIGIVAADKTVDDKVPFYVSSAIEAVVFTVSAFAGSSRANDCREAIAEHERHIAETPPPREPTTPSRFEVSRSGTPQARISTGSELIIMRPWEGNIRVTVVPVAGVPRTRGSAVIFVADGSPVEIPGRSDDPMVIADIVCKRSVLETIVGGAISELRTGTLVYTFTSADKKAIAQLLGEATARPPRIVAPPIRH